MKRVTTFLFVAVLLGLGASAATAQTQIAIGPRIGLPLGDLSDAEGQFFVGADARINSAAIPYPITINPSVDYYFFDVPDDADYDVSALAIDINALYEFGIDNQLFTPYAGGGIAITRYSAEYDGDFDFPGVDTDASTTEVGLNLVGGAYFALGSLNPFAQANFTIGGDIQRLGITAGLLFSIGG